MDPTKLKEEWRSSTMDPGELSVIMVGIYETRGLSAECWGSREPWTHLHQQGSDRDLGIYFSILWAVTELRRILRNVQILG